MEVWVRTLKGLRSEHLLMFILKGWKRWVEYCQDRSQLITVTKSLDRGQHSRLHFGAADTIKSEPPEAWRGFQPPALVCSSDCMPYFVMKVLHPMP